MWKAQGVTALTRKEEEDEGETNKEEYQEGEKPNSECREKVG
jgi:hypothetical protein